MTANNRDYGNRNTRIRPRRLLAGIAAALAGVLVLAMAVITDAQESSQTWQLAQRAVAPATDRLSSKLQTALEADSVVDDLQGIVVLCANACEPKSGANGEDGPVWSSRLYRCSGAGCECRGANACVRMIADDGMCQAGTVRCNDSECRCRQAGEGAQR